LDWWHNSSSQAIAVSILAAKTEIVFSVFSGGLLKIWGFCQILEMYVGLLYFPFKNTVASHA